MLCLGIESSCDDTSLALVENGVIRARRDASQAGVHALFGGVVPELASREHGRCIGALYDALLEDAGVFADAIELIAVTRGPGLLGSLLVGISFAKALSLGLGVPLIGVNHLHAHLMAAGLENRISFPAIGLLVSGGHTHLYRVEGPEKAIPLGRTLDDAAGETFDKAGKMLGMPYPAGRLIDQLAGTGRADSKLFPRPYLDNDNLDFSFSGLKTSMALRMRDLHITPARWDALDGELCFAGEQDKAAMADICASYTEAVVQTLTEKTERALVRNPDAGTLIIAGGVAANHHLRAAMKELAEKHGRVFVAPSSALCADNGAMVAYLGELLAGKGFRHSLSMEAIPRGKKIPDDYEILLQPEGKEEKN